ncbi:MAG: carbon dioxide concentrating mechanism protein CcmL [Gemmataceae bacterium]|nr:carbon dioxide concentrating mechanism protein CcmL [Gemmataceae bacterium]
MRVAEVIGTVTLSKVHPSLIGARWIIGVPCSLQALKKQGPGDGEDLVIFDGVGAGLGARVGFSEGGEGAAPFYPEKKPVDAYAALILDNLEIDPRF